MSIRMTLVHGNDDVEQITFATLGATQAYAVVAENGRHGTEARSLRQLMPDFEYTDAGRGWQQIGTNYHYVIFEEV